MLCNRYLSKWRQNIVGIKQYQSNKNRFFPYVVFRSKDTDKLLPEYLFLMLNRPEFDRYSRFNSWGSARETFDWSEMERVQIPLPSVEVQQAIVDVYHCMENAKQIAATAREKLKTLCPALVQRAAHS